MKYFLISNTHYFPSNDPNTPLAEVSVKFIAKGRDEDVVGSRLLHIIGDANIDREIPYRDFAFLRDNKYMTEV